MTPTAARRAVADRYQLLEPLGRGGMGVVWRATDGVLQRDVAIKEVEFPLTLDPKEREAMRTRVLREARAAARLNHPAAVTVFDVCHDDDTAFIVMELVEAPSLADLVDAEGPVSPERAAEIGLDVLDALEAAHARGIVHRDVKPANVMVPAEGRVKLADFGIASVKGDPKITATGLILGSPSYMAPEQAGESTSGPATDAWGLGATLYFAVEGEPPFDKGNAIGTLTAVLDETPRPMTRAGPLEPVIRKLLSKDPAERPSEPELCALLEAVREGRETTATTGHVGAAPTHFDDDVIRLEEAEEPAAEAEAYEEEPQPESRRRLGPWLVAAALLAAALLAALFLLPDDAPQRERAAETNDRQRNRRGAPAEAPAQEAAPEEAAAPAEEAEAATAPDGKWTDYTDPTVGYTISYPAGWSVATVDDTRTDFRDPETGAYLRVDWTGTPGEDPVAAWESYSQDFASRHPGYEEIQISPTTYKGMQAAIWEFQYPSGDTMLHAVDLGFVTRDDEYGFALNFQTRAEDWDDMQGVFDQFKASFSPPR